MSDNIKLEKPLSPEILLEISPNEIGSYKINNLSKKLIEVEVPVHGKTAPGEGRDVMLMQMMMGML